MILISVKVGDQVVYLGAGVSRPNTDEKLAPGDVGRVIRIRPAEPRDVRIDYDGHAEGALVEWPNYRPTLIWPEGEGKQWRRKNEAESLIRCPKCGEPPREVSSIAEVRCVIDADGSVGRVVRAHSFRGGRTYHCGGGHAFTVPRRRTHK